MLERSKPELQGVNSKGINAFIEAIEKNQLELHSFVIIKNNKIIVEGEYKPYSLNTPHALYSLSKSFTSSAIGFLCSEGLLNVCDRLIEIFPEDIPQTISDNLNNLRIKDILTMSTGHELDTLPAMFASENPIKTFFEQEIKYTPGSHFMYHNGATYILSLIIKKVTKMDIVDYLMPRLFEPLGITKPYWENSPHGHNIGAYGLYLKTEDIAKFGLLYLNKGLYNGKQIISEAWINEATKKQVNNDSLGWGEDWSQGYGYQFWRCRHNAYRADGAFGQNCVIIPDSNVVVAINSGLENLQLVLELIWEHLLPAFNTNTLMIDEKEFKKLCDKVSNLQHLPKNINKSSILLSNINNKEYVLGDNDCHFKTVKIDFNDQKIYLNDNEFTFKFGLGEWFHNESEYFAPFSSTYCSGTWLNEETFLTEIKVMGTPFTYYFNFNFNSNELTLDYSTNLGFYRDKLIASIKGGNYD